MLAPFRGTDRFSIQRRLGAGGFGIVYEAVDNVRQATVALKTLRNATPDALYRFKREFRSLAGIVHPNLVRLHELFSDGEEWFFTMDYVDGRNFLDYVWDGRAAGAVPAVTQPIDSLDDVQPTQVAPTPVVTPANERKLRNAAAQLAAAVQALHAHGKLHRDLKPSNVLVANDDRLVVLDFGLVSDLTTADGASVHIAGTPAYMSPEQASGQPLTAASDAYSLGVMLYEALTGMLPFSGNYYDVLAQKQRGPVAPASIAGNISGDLNDLCTALLDPDPAQRPALSDVAARLDRDRGSMEPMETAPQPVPLVGRAAELRELHDAMREAGEGRAVVVAVEGVSGIGKSALVRRFLAEARATSASPVILSGKCYEQESVPYKAVDSLIDDLARHLRQEPQLAVESIMPRDAHALARLFPVLRQVENFTSPRRRMAVAPDAKEVRRRGFEALRELLTRMTDQRPLVLFIDDVQWGDGDSAALLHEVFRPPDAPPLVLIASYRSEEAATSPFVAYFRDSLPQLGASFRHIVLRELEESASRELAAVLLAQDAVAAETVSDAILAEAGGSPFLIEQFVRFRAKGGGGTVSIAEMIRARVAGLSGAAAEVLRLVAANGQPVPMTALRRLLPLHGDRDTAIAMLRAEHLIRTFEAGRGEEVDAYHDKIRETVLASIPPAGARDLYARLGVALEEAGGADAELLAEHFRRAGDLPRASDYYISAANQAAKALAFARAARLYSTAIELNQISLPERRPILFRMAEALANAGRGYEAARVFRDAAAFADADEKLELERRAAEQLLMSGHMQEGLEALRSMLRSVRIGFPRNAFTTLLSLLRYRVRLALRGMAFRRRGEQEISRRDLIRIDTLWAAAMGLGMTDTVRGAVFQTRNLLLSLDAGEPYRIARSLAMETGFHSIRGGRAVERVAAIADRARSLAAEIEHPHATALMVLADAIIAWELGQWRKAVTLSERGETLLRETCRGVAWELATAHVFTMASLIWLGEWREHGDRLRKLVDEAESRGDLYAAVSIPILSYSHTLALAADRPDAAREGIRAALARWPGTTLDLQRYWAHYGEVEADIYDRNAAAWEKVQQRRGAVRRSLLLRVQTIAIFNAWLRGRAAIVAGRFDDALHEARVIDREKMAWGDGLAELLRASAAFARGNTASAIRSLDFAIGLLQDAEMSMIAAAAMRVRGALGGDDSMIARAEEAMRAQGIVRAERVAALFVPGCDAAS